MARRSAYHDTLPAIVRRYFGIPQDELALFLAMSQGQLVNSEAGRRGLGAEAAALLQPLAQQLPESLPPWQPFAPTPTEASAAELPPPGPLNARRNYCQHHLPAGAAARLGRAAQSRRVGPVPPAAPAR